MATLCPNADGSSPQQREFDEAPPMCIDPEKIYTATMVTSMGTMVIHLNAAQAPKTVNNFVTLARYHYYDGIIFHRIINGFMCQGGDFTNQNGTGGKSIYGEKFADENFDLVHGGFGTLSMANAGPNTNGSQFFICLDDTPWLNGNHAVFGAVSEGMDVVHTIERCRKLPGDRPAEPQQIIRCTVVAE